MTFNPDDPNPHEIRDERVIDCYDRPISLVIADIRKAEIGLDNPTLDINCNQEYDLCIGELVVSGTRMETQEEAEKRVADWEKHLRFTNYVKDFPG